MEDIFLAADEEKILALCRFDSPLSPSALTTAIRYVQQWQVVSWCRVQNTKGCAPPSSKLLDMFNCNQFEWPADFRPTPWGEITNGVSRTRLTRLRRRWRGRLGAIRVQDDVSEHVLREKAAGDDTCWNCCCWGGRMGAECARVRGDNSCL